MTNASIRKMDVGMGLILLLVSSSAWAVPSLQLYIDGGTYDLGTETWVTSDSSFTLQALATNSGNAAFTDNTVVNIAVALGSGIDPTSGSISINSTTLNPANFVFGVPPVGFDPGPPGNDSLAPHGIYDTWFFEYSFDLMSASCTACVQDLPNPGTAFDGWIKDFDVEISGYEGVHFDLYTTKDVSGFPAIDEFAPFSHDAEYTADSGPGPEPVPAPGTLAMLAGGIFGFSATRLRKRPS